MPHPSFAWKEFAAMNIGEEVIVDKQGGVWKPMERRENIGEIPRILMKSPYGRRIVVCFSPELGLCESLKFILHELNDPACRIIPAYQLAKVG